MSVCRMEGTLGDNYVFKQNNTVSIITALLSERPHTPSININALLKIVRMLTRFYRDLSSSEPAAAALKSIKLHHHLFRNYSCLLPCGTVAGTLQSTAVVRTFGR